ncbi:hypothetical protein PLESTB_000644200 [Pleodorina starrii]|uniref:DNA polymerase n=1 Tax=Pleodorina starrii TaxID=330485 RepID=A0A9W6BIR3_9CHLO|nr:hypothetical protein PLESTB_000644200 [Pleodorina starrii]
MERSRRQPVQSGAAAKAKSALEQLRAAREGSGKRALNFEVKEETAVYDVVDEQEYREIVKKRRDAGAFVIDDDGTGGYADIGEDDYWNERPDGEEGEEEAEDEQGSGGKHANKKRKKDHGKGGSKRKPGEGDEGPAKPEGGNITAMFRKARAAIPGLQRSSAAASSKATDASSDDVLDSILGDILPDTTTAGPPATAGGAAGGGGAATAAVGGFGARSTPGAALGAYGGRPAVVRPPHMPMGSGLRPGMGGAYGAAVPSRPVGGLAAVAALTSGAAAAAAAAAPRAAAAAAVQVKREEVQQYDVDEQMPELGGREMQPDDPMDVANGDAAAAAAGDAAASGGDGAAAAEAKAAPSAGAEGCAAQAGDAAGGKATGGGGGGSGGGRNFLVDAPATPLDGAPVQRAEDLWAEMYAGGAVADGETLTAPSTLPDGGAAAAAAGSTPGGDAAAAVGSLPLDGNGVMPFYMIDAYENPDARPGEAILFGKVECEGRWQSCGVVVRGLQRCLLVVPRPELFADPDGAIAAAEEAAAEDPARKADLKKMLQERCAPLREEVRGLLSKAGVGAMRMVPVKRSYAFENKDVPQGEQWVLKVRYPAHMPALQVPPAGGGRTFVAIFGAHQSGLEALMLKRRIKGPGWLGLVQPHRVEYANQSTWCKVEVVVDSPKKLLSGEKGLPAEAACRKAPPLVVASLSLKTNINPSSHQHEIVAASVVHLGCVSPDAPLAAKDWSPERMRRFSIVRRLDGQAWPHGMEAAAASANCSPMGRANGGNMVALQASERSLLTCLLARLQALDADVLVGHNIAAFDLTTLLTRMQHHKVPLWSRIGRVKKTEFPRLTGGGHTFGGGAGAGAMSTIAGRLLCDTYLSARELVKSVDFTLATLASSLLGKTRSDPLAEALATGGGAGAAGGGVGGGGLGGFFVNPDAVLRLLRHGESDAWLALGIMFQLSVLPLSKQLSVLSGQLWSRTLAGQRAQRIEMLLLHEFHRRKFICPDKQTYKDKQRRQQAEAEADDFDAGGGGGDDDGEEGAGGGGGKKGGGKKGSAAAAPKSNGPKYSGGLVLEPKKGLYDKIVIILDFNSLYPSIIQEYNICFTTVQRPEDGSLPPLPNPATMAKGLAPLPAVLQALVDRRRQVKSAMASERNPLTRQQLQIRQQALKLTANSMYGCLGFGASRFYAQPLAELITAQGRSILSSTVDLVQGSMGGEVIYGDTDSIMVATRSESVDEARALGARIKSEVNKRYKLLEIELDGVFRSILLLKKKKYAAMKLEPDGSGRLVEVMEQKGLDIVRRDWCLLSKDEGNFALAAILSGRNREEVVADIHTHLRSTAERLRAGQIPLGKFIIYKQLTKRPEDYPDARNQPHVQVALRRRAAGRRDGVLPGETVPYIICVERPREATAVAPAADGAATATDGSAAAAPAPAAPSLSGGCSGSLAERARHPDELRENPGLAVDVEYYLAQQIHPVVSRLVSPIEGTDAAHIADCLGLDPARYRGASGAGGGSGGCGGGDDEDSGLLMGSSTGTLMDEDDNFRSCAPLLLTSPNGCVFPLRGIDEVLRGGVLPEHLLTPPDALGDETAELGPAALANQVLLRAREAVARYYDGALRPDDETAEVAGGCRAAVLRLPGGGGAAGGGEDGPAGPDRCAHPDPARTGVLLRRAVGERDLYLQLSHYYRLLHVDGAVRRHFCRLKAADPKSQISMEDVRAMVPEPLVRTLSAAAEAVDSLRRRSHWHWVDLARLFGCLEEAALAQQQQPSQQQKRAADGVGGVGQAHGRAPAGAGAAGLVNLASVRGVVA